MNQKAASKRNSFLLGTAILAVVAVIGVYAIMHQSMHNSIVLEQFKLEEEEFSDFLSKYNKSYKTEEEYLNRFKIFRDNLAFIRVHNSQEKDWTLGVNHFADLSFEEFGNIHLKKIDISSVDDIPHSEHLENLEAPISVDWRTKGVVTGIKYQSMCGGCWAFATVASVESSWAIAGHALTVLSEQQLLDCGGPFGTYGCSGGNTIYGYSYVQKYGLTSESNYHFKGVNGICNTAAVEKKSSLD